MSARREPGRLRVAVSLRPHVPTAFAAGVSDEVRHAVARTAALLRELGHEVAERDPKYGQLLPDAERLTKLAVPSSGPVDRYYFRSLYFREPNGILFEIATDGPGFASDEPMETLGERLALPPFLEPRRAEIERGLKPLATA